ncbi:MAG: hypothetical protein R3E93_09770 [Thiothrix sp.]
MEQQHNTFNAGLAFSDFKQRQFFYILAAAVAFAMSSYFVVGYLAGNLLPWTWDSGQWMNGFVGIGITAVMTSYQFFLYSQGDVEGGKKATLIAVCVAVGFSLLSEVGQGMERDTIRMETKSQEAPAYKAIVGALSGSAGASYNPYSADLQAAEKKLARCNEIKAERLAKGKEYDCIESQAGVDAVNQMIANADRQSQSKALALAQTAKTMERDEKNYHPLVNLIRETFNATGTVGSFLLSLTLISFFEYAFHYLGGQYAKAREYLMQNGYDVTRKLRQPPRKHDGSISTYSDNSPALSAFDSAKMTVGEYAAKVEGGLQAAPEIIATEYARAQHAREQVYSKAADKLDSIQDDLNKHAAFLKLLVMEAQASVNHGMEPTHENVKSLIAHVLRRHQQTTGQNTQHVDLDKLAGLVIGKLKPAADISQTSPGKTYRQELAEGEKAYSDSPLDKPRPASRMSVADTVQRIQRDVKANGATSPEAIQAAVFDAFAAMPNPAPLNDVALNKIADKLVINRAHTTAPALPANQKPGGTGLQNPALGTAEEHFALPLNGLGQVKKQPDLSGQPDLGNLTGQVGQVKNSPDLKSPDLTLKLTETEHKLINSEAEKVRLQQQAEAEKVRLQQQAEADRKRAEEAAEAKRQAEQRAIEAERKRAAEQLAREQAEAKMKADLEAAEAEKVRLQQQAEADLKQAEADRKADLERAEAEAEKVRLQQQAEADRKADLGDLTEGQVRLAAEAIKAAILSGQVTGLGRATLKPVLADAGLPRSTDAVKVLIKWGCTDLIGTGLVARNPEPGNGKPEFVIA